ncbi:MAG: DUF1674 domain-containing protein [Geminicoccaceae bacterium]
MPGDRSGPSKAEAPRPDRKAAKPVGPSPADAKEIGGPKGPEPTRYGDWEKGGRCSDF